MCAGSWERDQWHDSPLVDPLVCPFVPFPFENAGTLRLSNVPGTSILGLTLKKEDGLNVTLKCSTGILGAPMSHIRPQ